MKSIVIDASVAIKWFVPEVHSLIASSLLSKRKNLKFIAPDLIFAEVGNILWKKCRMKELTVYNANDILLDFKKLPIHIHGGESLLEIAWQIATKHDCTVYDSLYVALAQMEGSLLVTADKALYNKLINTYLSSFLLWVEDVKTLK